METKANHALVGLFTLAALLLGFVFVYWLARFDETAQRQSYYVIFDGAVTGLSTGGAVLFNGIKVGEVTALQVDVNRPSAVRALIKIDRAAPIKTDTVARLEYQGLTGVAHVQLTGGSGDASPLAEPGEERIPEIIAEKSQFQDLLDVARDIMSKGTVLFGRIDRILGDNEEAVKRTVLNVEKFSQMLADNSDRVAGLIQDTSDVAEQIGAFSRSLDKLIGELDSFVGGDGSSLLDTMASAFRRLDTFLADNEEPLGTSIANVEKFTSTLADNTQNIDQFIADAAALTSRLGGVAERLDAVVTRADTLVGADAEALIAEARQAFSGVAEFMKENGEPLGRVVGNVDSFTQSLAGNTETLDKLFADAAQVAEKLNTVSDRFDTFLTRADSMLGENPENLFRDATAAFERLDAFLAANEAALTKTVANVETFTTTLADNSVDFERLIKDAGELAGKLNTVSGDIEELVKRVDGLVATDGTAFLAEARKAAETFRELAENLEGRLDTATEGLSRATGRGLREFESFVVEGRSALQSLKRVVDRIERDPGRFLSGGRRVPEYRGR